jgi:hypothetical protein
MPGFNAGSSLGPTKGMYRSGAVLGRSDGILPMLEKQRSCTTKYWGYVDYPMTVCSGWGDFVTGLGSKTVVASPNVADRMPPSRSVEHLKLSAVPSVASRVSRFCHVSGGPWAAQVTTTEFCNDYVPDFSVLEIVGAPEPLSIQWSGDITNIPTPFRKQDFVLAGTPVCSCCGGFSECPDGRCVPRGTSCDIHPA